MPASQLVPEIANEPLSQPERLMRVQRNPGELSDQEFPISTGLHTIQVGDMLSQLCIGIYGFTSPELYQFLQANNPRLVDTNDISLGDIISFPVLTDELQTIRNIEIERRLRNLAPPTGVTRLQEVVE